MADNGMELFTINRYTGNKDDQANPNEEELRKELLQKIKDRKRKTEVLQENEAEKIKCKKNKQSHQYLEQHSDDSIKTDKTLQKLKKKKKEFTELIDNQLINNFEVKGKKKKHRCKETNDSNEGIKLDYNEIEDDKDATVTENQPAFTILKDPHFYRKEKVKRKLPNWLANPSVVSVDLKNLTHPVDSIRGLDNIFVNKLKENNITHFFPVQHQIIPALLENENRPYQYWPSDICVSAPTGSGKTLAFVLPILQVLHKRIVPKIRALVVLPVQDLANQVYKVFKAYSECTDLTVLLLSKLQSFEEEQKLISRNDGVADHLIQVDVVVTTPGRLVEHLTKTRGFCLDELKYLVIDEADRVMENVQNDWLYHLNKHINSECTRAYQVPFISYNSMLNKKRPPQKLLFSATLSQDPEKLQQLGLFYPKLFTSIVKSKNDTLNDKEDESKFIGKYTTPAELKEYYALCTKANKPLILHHLIMAKGWRNILCFVNSAQATTKLAFILRKLSKNSIKIHKLSANLKPKDRELVLQNFHQGKIDVLISSDALARGIDIPSVEYVISYDCPAFVKTYVHRIGRTGRAGKTGISLTFLTEKEVTRFNKMMCSAGKNSLKELEFGNNELEEYEENFEKALTALATYLDSKRIKELKNSKKRKKIQTLAEKGKFLAKRQSSANKILKLKKLNKKKNSLISK